VISLVVDTGARLRGRLVPVAWANDGDHIDIERFDPAAPILGSQDEEDP